MTDKQEVWWKDESDTLEAIEPPFDLAFELGLYRDMKNAMAAMLNDLKGVERKIKNHVLETGELAEVDGASITIRKAYDRVSWDGRALIGYAAAHPEIDQFKKIVSVKAAAVIKVR